MNVPELQKRLWAVVTEAHAAGDRADARILMGMIEALDLGDFGALPQMLQALRQAYRAKVGPLPPAAGTAITEDGAGS